ncbi:MAG: AraC family transcriptional regulator [Verrucomicrobiota bacterium]
MMKHFRPLFLQNLNTQVDGYEILRLQINRHLRELDRLDYHKHDEHQLLVYLAGGGYQRGEDTGFAVKGGSVVWVPAGVLHSFRETAKVRPLCLVLDFAAPQHDGHDIRQAHLPQKLLVEIKEHISDLMRQASGELGERGTLRTCGRVLMILEICLSQIGLLQRRTQPLMSPVVRSAKRHLQDRSNYHIPLSAIAQRMGYQPNYLNKLLKESTGLTLGQMRSQRILEEAEKQLISGVRVGDVAEELGFLDQNYFARWFKRQRGEAPTQWLKTNRV